jgi:putative NIF3 family GTP cyclohydrolase 1 type 2
VASKHVLRPVADPSGAEASPDEGPQAGYGIITTLSQEVPALPLVKGVGRLLGGLTHLSVAEPAGCELASARVRSIAVCAGSGGDVLRGCGAELWVTGEMSHHEALAATQSGKIVVTTFHSNTERRFLDVKLRGLLEGELRQGGRAETEVKVSERDRDPFRTLALEGI